jgi:hypothetical protein
MSAHTPAPWEATENDVTGCAYITSDATGGEVAVLYADKSDERDADARLIAAAPDLLKAASAAVEIVKESWGDDQIEHGDCQACNLLLAAIAKATGGES